jgi:pilus assembly protein FimV
VMGRALDPANAMFAGAPAGVEVSRGPTTELRLGPTTVRAAGATTGGFTAPPATLGGEETTPETEEPVGQATPSKMPGASDSVMSDSQMGAETVLPIDPSTNVIAPTTQGAKTRVAAGGSDLSDLEFEAVNTIPAQRFLDTEVPVTPPVDLPLQFDLDRPTVAPKRVPELPPLPDLDLTLPATGPVTAGPKPPATAPAGLDFELPTTRPPAKVETVAAAGHTAAAAAAGPRTRPAPLEDALSRPSLLGDLGALPESPTRLASNTDQATVPLIDFDLTGAELPLNTTPGRGGTPTGSPMASQMATKLDLARGYIDLGVKDGARELLEEVMRDGTREQRQTAIELMKQIER